MQLETHDPCLWADLQISQKPQDVSYERYLSELLTTLELGMESSNNQIQQWTENNLLKQNIIFSQYNGSMNSLDSLIDESRTFEQNLSRDSEHLNQQFQDLLKKEKAKENVQESIRTYKEATSLKSMMDSVKRVLKEGNWKEAAQTLLKMRQIAHVVSELPDLRNAVEEVKELEDVLKSNITPQLEESMKDYNVIQAQELFAIADAMGVSEQSKQLYCQKLCDKQLQIFQEIQEGLPTQGIDDRSKQEYCNQVVSGIQVWQQGILKVMQRNQSFLSQVISLEYQDLIFQSMSKILEQNNRPIMDLMAKAIYISQQPSDLFYSFCQNFQGLGKDFLKLTFDDTSNTRAQVMTSDSKEADNRHIQSQQSFRQRSQEIFKIYQQILEPIKAQKNLFVQSFSKQLEFTVGELVQSEESYSLDLQILIQQIQALVNIENQLLEKQVAICGGLGLDAILQVFDRKYGAYLEQIQSQVDLQLQNVDQIFLEFHQKAQNRQVMDKNRDSNKDKFEEFFEEGDYDLSANGPQPWASQIQLQNQIAVYYFNCQGVFKDFMDKLDLNLGQQVIGIAQQLYIWRAAITESKQQPKDFTHLINAAFTQTMSTLLMTCTEIDLLDKSIQYIENIVTPLNIKYITLQQRQPSATKQVLSPRATSTRHEQFQSILLQQSQQIQQLQQQEQQQQKLLANAKSDEGCGIYKQVEAAVSKVEKSLGEIIFRVLIMEAQGIVSDFESSPIWMQESDNSGFAIPLLTAYPTNTASAIGELVFELHKRIEQVYHQIENKNQYDEQQFLFSWLDKLSSGSVSVFCKQCLKIQYLSYEGSQQLQADLVHLKNVLSAQQIQLPAILQTLLEFNQYDDKSIVEQINKMIKSNAYSYDIGSLLHLLKMRGIELDINTQQELLSRQQ